MTQEDSIVHTKPAADPTNDAAAAPQSTAPPTNDPHDDHSTQPYSADDLIALIRAIKFAHPEMSQRHVHSEITTVAADSDPSYHFLKHVDLNDVKKVWKKALRGSDSRGDGSTPIATQKEATTNIPNKQKEEEDDDERATPIFPPNNNNGILKFYTVGDASVQTLAQNYATHYARAAAQASTNNNDNNTDDDATASNYTHFFLDVPADRSGSRPHQALINYSDSNVVRTTTKDQRTHPTTKSSSSSSSSHHGNNKKKEKKKNRSNANQRPSNDTEGREIFKIQMAASPPGMEDVSLPMLLYNADRSAKTFLHPPSTREDDHGVVGEEGEEEDDGGYFKIQERIRNNGTCGALGKSGGQKAYFWGIVREVEGDDQRRVVSLDVEELAPNQVW
ncbi:hypothetical protein HJC23_003467 [Cyclotella cryptica]|uniref:Uncharacterized protein n=1 Tax=Cyclotella cryptica TaxID=29204 RepID=A0ABD3QSH5_9STRA